jgi:integral membrane sensor domain MASE1
MFMTGIVRHPVPALRSTLGVRRLADPRYFLNVALLAIAYVASAKLGYWLEFAGPVAAIVWLPVGVGISSLYLFGLRYWPAIVVGDLLSNDWMKLPVGVAFSQTAGNLLEVVIAALLLLRLAQNGSPLRTVRGVAQLIGLIAVATLTSATIGTVALRAGGVIDSAHIANVWRTWWLGDACGALVVTPLAIAWSKGLPRAWDRPRLVEGALLAVAVVVLNNLALHNERPLAYVAFPTLIWAAIRFGERGATLAILATAAFAVWNTTHYEGPFSFESITRSVLSTQLYISIVAASTLSLAALASERERFAERLGASRDQALDAADRERRRIERNLHDGAQQRLLALAVRLELARQREAPSAAATMLGEAIEELELAVDELRELAHGVRRCSPISGSPTASGASLRGRSSRSRWPGCRKNESTPMRRRSRISSPPRRSPTHRSTAVRASFASARSSRPRRSRSRSPTTGSAERPSTQDRGSRASATGSRPAAGPSS